MCAQAKNGWCKDYRLHIKTFRFSELVKAADEVVECIGEIDRVKDQDKAMLGKMKSHFHDMVMNFIEYYKLEDTSENEYNKLMKLELQGKLIWQFSVMRLWRMERGFAKKNGQNFPLPLTLPMKSGTEMVNVELRVSDIKICSKILHALSKFEHTYRWHAVFKFIIQQLMNDVKRKTPYFDIFVQRLKDGVSGYTDIKSAEINKLDALLKLMDKSDFEQLQKLFPDFQEPGSKRARSIEPEESTGSRVSPDSEVVIDALANYVKCEIAYLHLLKCD